MKFVPSWRRGKPLHRTPSRSALTLICFFFVFIPKSYRRIPFHGKQNRLFWSPVTQNGGVTNNAMANVKCPQIRFCNYAYSVGMPNRASHLEISPNLYSRPAYRIRTNLQVLISWQSSWQPRVAPTEILFWIGKLSFLDL